MAQDEVSQIKVDGDLVGIIGLKAVIEEMAGEYAGKQDREATDELLNRLSRRNYIPDRLKETYGRAFLREFKKFLGRPCEEEASGGMDIKVLGPGCTQCDKLERELMEVMVELGLAASIEHVTDLKEIAKYGVMGTPALIVNGKVKAVGRVPPRKKIVQWLKEARD